MISKETRCPSCQRTINIKALKETQRNAHRNRKITPPPSGFLFLIHQMNPKERGHQTALWCQ